MTGRVLQLYGLRESDCRITPLTSGLINATWKLESKGNSYILQRINHEVFRQPEAIEANIAAIAGYLQTAHPDYLFTAPVPTTENRGMVHIPGEGYFRMFPFIKGTHTIQVVNHAEEAYQAAYQFGKFTAVLGGFDAAALQPTIPGFHDIEWRFHQFREALEKGNPLRLKQAAGIIGQMQEHTGIVDGYIQLRKDPLFRLRVTHHDTKISNVLFNTDRKAVCVIDLDTVMPGYFISDVGDMIRTYVCPVSEEEKDISRIHVRQDVYAAIREGYLACMDRELSDKEKGYFSYAGQFLIYMQALRFLSDYLMNDVYYATSYPGQNFIRTQNQLSLLERFIAMNG